MLPASAQQTVGLFINNEDSYNGYTLFAPMPSTSTYLIDNDGKLINTWVSSFRPGMSAYLLDDGNLLRTGIYAPDGIPRFEAGGKGGRIEEYDWDGTLIWDYTCSDAVKRQHHDIEPLPNGNLLLVVWELKSFATAVAAGRDLDLLSEGELWPDQILEIEPVGQAGGVVVWEWHVWDHLIQEYDPTKGNYGVVADHPELVNLNYPATGPNPGKADWNHVNAIDYNPELDQIMISVRTFDEIWIIDHSTSTSEAAGHSGGISGMGGDLLYRWGNPQAYNRGDESDRMFFGQHDSRWIEPDLPGAGNILVFNNGRYGIGGSYSTVDEVVPPVDQNGHYDLRNGSAFGPGELLWHYVATPQTSFFSQNISGAHRLPNGNTLICDGPHGTFFEVTQDLDTVWKYVSPITLGGPLNQEDPPLNNSVFRVHRYRSDYPAFAGRDMTPGDSIELFNRPVPAPDGEAATDPMTASRLTVSGDWIEVNWDAGSCLADDYNLIFGNLSDLSPYVVQGAECAIGVTGTHDWQGVPPGDLYFLIVGVDDTGIYESSWGSGTAGIERNGSSSSFTCGVTTRDSSETCQ